MVVERKILLGIGDIRAVSFQCDRCAYRVTMLPEKISVPTACPEGHGWTRGQQQISQRDPVAKLGEVLGTLRTLTENKAIGFQIFFEFDEPK